MSSGDIVPELERLLDSDTDEPIVVNPPPPKAQRRVRFSAGSRFPKTNQPIFEESKYHRLTLEHINANKWAYYTTDIFHTLINMRTYRFFVFFVTSYVSMYSLFAALYISEPEHCIFNVHNFWHALWFSVITSATIGYGHQAPDPDCFMVNFYIMLQVLTGLLMQAALLGLVYARVSAPGSRARTIKFSSIMTCYKGNDGLYRLAFRVANMRRHQVLQPEVQLLMIRKEHVGGPDGPLEYRYHELPVTHISGRKRLWLGVPSIVAHKINMNSPLWGATPASLVEAEGLEFVALLDGIDESTSTVMQARHSYTPADIRWGHSFIGVLARGGSGALTADYSHFDLTRMEQDNPHGATSETSLVGSIPENEELDGEYDADAGEEASPVVDLPVGVYVPVLGQVTSSASLATRNGGGILKGGVGSSSAGGEVDLETGQGGSHAEAMSELQAVMHQGGGANSQLASPFASQIPRRPPSPAQRLRKWVSKKGGMSAGTSGDK